MSSFYLATAQVERAAGDGSMKRVSEQYLVDAMSFTEAEERVCSELVAEGDGDLQITRIIKPRLAEVFLDNGTDCTAYYRVKIIITAIDEKTGKEKMSPVAYLVQAISLEDAIVTFKAQMLGTVSDWTLVSVTETAIVGYIGAEA